MQYIYTQKRSNFYIMDVKTVTVKECVFKYKTHTMICKGFIFIVEKWSGHLATHCRKNPYGILSPVIFNGLLLFILMTPTPSFFLVTFFLVCFCFKFVHSSGFMISLSLHDLLKSIRGRAPEQRCPSHGGTSGKL